MSITGIELTSINRPGLSKHEANEATRLTSIVTSKSFYGTTSNASDALSLTGRIRLLDMPIDKAQVECDSILSAGKYDQPTLFKGILLSLLAIAVSATVAIFLFPAAPMIIPAIVTLLSIALTALAAKVKYDPIEDAKHKEEAEEFKRLLQECKDHGVPITNETTLRNLNTHVLPQFKKRRAKIA